MALISDCNSKEVFREFGCAGEPERLTKRRLFVAVFAMMGVTASSNYLVQIDINEWLTYGAFTYPLTFFVTEVTNRFFGPRSARRVAYAGFGVAVVLGFSFMNRRIAFASSAAFLIGQLLDIAVFNRLRRGTWWLAPAASSVCASAIDTVIFFPLAFAGTGVSWIKLSVGDFLVKLLMDLLMLVPFRLFLWRKSERGASRFRSIMIG